MQILYSIYVNQGAFTEYAPNVSIEAACIFNFMQQKVALKEYQKHTIKENDNLYFWFSHSLIEEQMPILFKGSKTSAAISLKVRRIISELEDNGIIEKHPNVKSLKRSMYCFTDKADLLVTKKETYKSEQVSPKQTYKSVRVRRTNLYESNPKETYKSVREVEYQSNLVEYNKVERESEKEFSQPLPPVSEIQNLIEVELSHPDEVNDDLINNPKGEKEQENEGAAAIVKFEQNYEPLPEKAKKPIADSRKKKTFDNPIQLTDFLRYEVFNKESNEQYCNGLKNAYNVAKIKFSGEVYEKTILQFSLHQFSNLSEKQIVQFSIDELYSKICTWVLREGNYQASKQTGSNLTFQKQPEKITQNTGTDLNAFLKTLNAYR